MLEVLIDNICVMFGGRIFQQKQSSFLWILTVPSSFRLVPLFARDRRHTRASEKTRKEASSIL